MPKPPLPLVVVVLAFAAAARASDATCFDDCMADHGASDAAACCAAWCDDGAPPHEPRGPRTAALVLGAVTLLLAARR